MERKRLKQQKMSFVNSIFNSSVSKLATHLWPNDNHGNRRQITKKRVFFEKVESLSFSKKGSIPKKGFVLWLIKQCINFGSSLLGFLILVSKTSQLKYYKGELLKILLDCTINDGNETGIEQKLVLLRNTLVIIKCNINKNKSNWAFVCIYMKWTLQVSLTALTSFMSFSDS